MKKIFAEILFVFVLFAAASLGAQAKEKGDTKVLDARIRVTKIWDKGTHAAFTSLVKFKGQR